MLKSCKTFGKIEKRLCFLIHQHRIVLHVLHCSSGSSSSGGYVRIGLNGFCGFNKSINVGMGEFEVFSNILEKIRNHLWCARLFRKALNPRLFNVSASSKIKS